MNRTIGILAMLSVCHVLASCDDRNECDSISDCYFDYPDSGKVEVQVKINEQNPHVPITIFDGYVDNRKVLFRDTLYAERTDYYLIPDRRYSIEAKYRKHANLKFPNLTTA